MIELYLFLAFMIIAAIVATEIKDLLSAVISLVRLKNPGILVLEQLLLPFSQFFTLLDFIINYSLVKRQGRLRT
ncbi:unnamed protein product [marine sediment metagenome]|uniref:Uncharacterized protein n=1 Tax=marine sediment metagenome TaxID=412755 RepID=X1RW23_9ZZZZ